MHKNKLINRRGPARGWYWSTYSKRTKYLQNENKSIDIHNLNFFLKLYKLKIKIVREDDYDFKTDKFNNKTVFEKEYRDVLFRINLSYENHYKFDNNEDDKEGLFFLHKMMFRFKGCQKLNSGYKNISFLDDLERDYWKAPIISPYPGSSVKRDFDYGLHHRLIEGLFMIDFDLKLNRLRPEFELELKEKVITPGYVHYQYSFNGCGIKRDIHWTTKSMYKMCEKGDDSKFNVITLLTNPSYFKNRLKENENIA